MTRLLYNIIGPTVYWSLGVCVYDDVILFSNVLRGYVRRTYSHNNVVNALRVRAIRLKVIVATTLQQHLNIFTPT